MATGLENLIARLDAMAGKMSVAAGDLGALAPQLGAAAAASIRQETPVAKSGYPNPYFKRLKRAPGTLKNSTRFTARVEGGRIVIAVIQDAEADRDLSGNWGGPYVQFVINPTGVYAGNGPIIPRYKRALAGPFFGPAMRSKGHPANRYPERAQPAIIRLTATIGATWARERLLEVVR